MAEKIKCPVCGKYEFEERDDFDICDVCDWSNDDYQRRHPDYRGGGNHMSVIDARQAYKEGRQIR
nr:MAG TPA: cysteine-rich protein [Caudoviricetes sp.]